MKSLEQLEQNAKATLSNSKLYSTINEFYELVKVFPESTFDDGDLKPKQLNRMQQLCVKNWPLHNAFHATINEIKGSVILQGTDNVIPFIVSECATFCHHLTKFNDQAFKIAKQMPELNHYYQGNFTLKPKDVLSILLDEINEWSVKYNFIWDKSEVVKQYKFELGEKSNEKAKK